MPFSAGVLVLVELGVVLAVLLVVRVAVAHRIPADAVPTVLRGRVAHTDRAMPWLLGGAVALVAVGVQLYLAG